MEGRSQDGHVLLADEGRRSGMCCVVMLICARVLQAIQFTVDKQKLRAGKERDDKLNEDMIQCSLDDPEGCVMCSG